MLLKARTVEVEKVYTEARVEWKAIEDDANNHFMTDSMLDKVYAKVEKKLVVLQEAASGKKRTFEEYAEEDVEGEGEEDAEEAIEGHVDEDVDEDAEEDVEDDFEDYVKKNVNENIEKVVGVFVESIKQSDSNNEGNNSLAALE